MIPAERPRPMNSRILPRKQRASHEQFMETWKVIDQLVTKAELDDLIERTVRDIKLVTHGKKVAYAWSAGKDSQALRYVCELAGVNDCMMGMTGGLEWPAFLRWATNNMPHNLDIIANDWDLNWLAKHPEMLFPSDSKTAAKWFKGIQHAAQAEYFHRTGIDMLLLGRRAQDGNYMGRDGTGIYTSKGVTRYSPQQYWRHVDVLAVCHYYKVPLPPIYDWPRGFRIGTGAWAARQYCVNHDQGWSECWTIDPDVVRGAAQVLPEAADWMRRNGVT